MPTNIEIKARAGDARRQMRLAEQISDGPPEVLDQRDTFFCVPAGRLKLRELAPDRGELIHYEREDTTGPKASRYAIFTMTKPDDLRKLLGAALGVRGEVRKRRLVFHAGQTRLHFDEVEGLGIFLELEVVQRPDQSREEGIATARKIMNRLEIQDGDLVDGAYIDLILGHC